MRLDHKKRKRNGGWQHPPARYTINQLRKSGINMRLPIMNRAQGSRLRGCKANCFYEPLAPNPEPKQFLGGYAEGVTPVPIPNTEVKPLRVDGTAWVAMWESRSPPGILFKKAPSLNCGGALLRSGSESALNQTTRLHPGPLRLLRPALPASTWI